MAKTVKKNVVNATVKGDQKPNWRVTYLIEKNDMLIKSEELSKFGITDSKKKSLTMTKLKNNKIIQSIQPGGRIYTINFSSSYLLRGIIKILEKEGFVSDFLNKQY